MDAKSMQTLTSSERHDWPTPRAFFAAADRLFVEEHGGPFELDAAASSSNAKCDRFFDESDNGLRQPWSARRVWLNPPYGSAIPVWITKAIEESRRGAIVAVLIPARVDTVWFHNAAAAAAEIRFVKGRITFAGAAHAAPFPSALLIFRHRWSPPSGERVVWWDWSDRARNLELFER